MYKGNKKQSNYGMKSYKKMEGSNIFYEDYSAPSNLPQNSYVKMAAKTNYYMNRPYPDSPKDQVEQMNDGVRGMNKQKIDWGY